jgi:hypothetical protein
MAILPPRTRAASNTRPGRALCLTVAVVTGLAVVQAAPAHLSPTLGEPEVVAPGIEFYRLSDPALLSPPGPVAAQLLRLDPGRVVLRLVLAQDTVLGLETVPDMALRSGATAAINGGFFLPTGEPAGLLKIDGELVSEIASHRGAVALVPGGFGRRPRLLFDQVSASVVVDLGSGKRRREVPVDAIDTVRAPGALVLFTPRFWTDTRTPCDGGSEFVFEGHPLALSERREAACTAAIPRDGGVLAAGPAVPAERLAGLTVGTRAQARAVYRTLKGTKPADWEAAPDIVGGVGLLASAGRLVKDWGPEKARDGFTTERHPRTVIGRAGDGRIWLITVDGRNKALSLGMNFSELQTLMTRVGLVDALNLDGGGSTTMVVRSTVMNHPSDATGPRKVSDAIIVRAR